MSLKPSLKVTHLRKEYRVPQAAPFVAVQDVSFEIFPGECFGLLGPNGAGKSTSIQCITGFYPVTSGNVLIQGVDAHREPKVARQFLGFCSQDDTLDTDFNVLDQLVRYAAFFRVPEVEARKRAQALLVRFGLQDKARDKVESLSGGMRRRLQVARALISEPRLLVLDEPTTGLDPEVRRTLWEILMECRARGMAILLCTHYMEEAQRLCDRIAVISSGKLLDLGSPDALIAKHVPQAEIEEELRPGVVWKRPPNLEDVYLKLAGSRLAGHSGSAT